MSRRKSYTVHGYLKPKHRAGTRSVRIYKWKKTSSGRWKKRGFVRATARTYRGYTKYVVKMRLAQKGKWRLRAYTPASHGRSASWSSGYDYVRVK